jgi:hypothetical protein
VTIGHRLLGLARVFWDAKIHLFWEVKTGNIGSCAEISWNHNLVYGYEFSFRYAFLDH